MLKPFYQGKLDAFCAVYAVLNAFRITNGIRTTKAREILNDTLLNLSLNPSRFAAFLNQQTDYVDVVDSLLDKLHKPMHTEVKKPFDKKPDVEEFWQTCSEWLDGGGQKNHSAIILRFLRYADVKKPPFNRHWTTVDYVKEDILHLFDCSHEAEAILNVHKNSFVLQQNQIDAKHLIYIPAESVRFIRLIR